MEIDYQKTTATEWENRKEKKRGLGIQERQRKTIEKEGMRP